MDASLVSSWSGMDASLVSSWSGMDASLVSSWSGMDASLVSSWTYRMPFFIWSESEKGGISEIVRHYSVPLR